jgi:hypothetical protein
LGGGVDMSFPLNPIDGITYKTSSGTSYRFNSEVGAWQKETGVEFVPGVTILGDPEVANLVKKFNSDSEFNTPVVAEKLQLCDGAPIDENMIFSDNNFTETLHLINIGDFSDADKSEHRYTTNPTSNNLYQKYTLQDISLYDEFTVSIHINIVLSE